MKNTTSNTEKNNSSGNLFMANLIATDDDKKSDNVIKYKRIDCENGYLTNQTEIDNFKTYQRKDIVSNNLLGDYNDKGDYVLSEELLDSLVKINKVMINNYNNIYFLKSNYVFEFKNNLQFCIVIKENKTKTEHTATAILKLLENVSRIGGYIQNTNSFVVAIFTDVFDPTFYQKVKKVFNVLEANERVGQEKDGIIELINKRILLMQRLNKLSSQQLFEIEKGYYEARIQMLKDMNMEDIFIYFQALQEKTLVFLQPTSLNYYRYLNELLDNAIEHQVLVQPSFLQEYNRIMLPVTARYNQDITAVYDTQIVKAKSPILQKQKIQSKKENKSIVKDNKSKSGAPSKGGTKKSSNKSDKKSSAPKKKEDTVKKPEEEKKPNTTNYSFEADKKNIVLTKADMSRIRINKSICKGVGDYKLKEQKKDTPKVVYEEKKAWQTDIEKS